MRLRRDRTTAAEPVETPAAPDYVIPYQTFVWNGRVFRGGGTLRQALFVVKIIETVGNGAFYRES